MASRPTGKLILSLLPGEPSSSAVPRGRRSSGFCHSGRGWIGFTFMTGAAAASRGPTHDVSQNPANRICTSMRKTIERKNPFFMGPPNLGNLSAVRNTPLLKLYRFGPWHASKKGGMASDTPFTIPRTFRRGFQCVFEHAITASRDPFPCDFICCELKDMVTEAYFLSDIHLKSLDQPDAQVLVGFLDDLGTRTRATHLFLVGDIFDFWLGGHEYFVRKFAPIVDRLERIVADGVEVHYFEGNHDLYLRDFWQDRMGVRVHGRAHLFQLGNLRVRVEHGDLLDPADRGYRFLRWLLRTPVIAFAGSRLPGGVLARIGRAASRTSRRYTSQHKTISDDRARSTIRSHAKRVNQEEPFDLIVSGHVHLRDDYEFESDGRKMRSVNLGSWADGPCAFRITRAGQEFIDLPLENPGAKTEEEP